MINEIKFFKNYTFLTFHHRFNFFLAGSSTYNVNRIPNIIEIIICMGTAHNGIFDSPSIGDIRLGPYIIQLIQKIVGSWTKYIAIDILPKNYNYKAIINNKCNKKSLLTHLQRFCIEESTKN